MAQIFLCHAKEETFPAEEIASRLQANGLATTGSTQAESEDDESLHEKIIETIKKCEIFLLLWNENSATSPEVMYEWTNALNLQKHLLICRFDKTEIPEVLKDTKSIPFVDFNKGYQFLAQNILKKYPLKVQAVTDSQKNMQNATSILPQKDAKPEPEPKVIIGSASKKRKNNEIKSTAVFEYSKTFTHALNQPNPKFQAPIIRQAKNYRLEIIIPVIIILVLAVLVLLMFLKKKQTSTAFRATPATVTEVELQRMIKLNNFFALTWNDSATGFKNEYIIKDNDGQKIIIDEKSGLIWQQSGSDKEIPQDEIDFYLDTINKTGFAGYSDWRLPTLEEALTLTESYINLQELHIDPIFTGLWCIWTADKNEYGQRWALNFYTRPRVDVNEGVHVRACR